MSQNTDEIKVLRAAKDAAAKLTATEQSLREQHDRLVRERQQAWSALASRDAVLVHAERLVDATAAQWRQDHGAQWVHALSGHRDIKVSGLGTDREITREVTVAPRLPELHSVLQAPGALTFADLCGLAPALVTASLAEMIRATPDERFGLPDQDRTAKLADYDAQIADVEARHTELVDAAGDVGITLLLLASVRARREAEALRMARERELEAQRVPVVERASPTPHPWSARAETLAGA